jgi:hypothetical protein
MAERSEHETRSLIAERLRNSGFPKKHAERAAEDSVRRVSERKEREAGGKP